MPLNISIEHKLRERREAKMQFTTKLACLTLALLLAGCSTFFSSIGPSGRAVTHSADERSLPPVQVIDVNEEVTRRLVAQRDGVIENAVSVSYQSA